MAKQNRQARDAMVVGIRFQPMGKLYHFKSSVEKDLKIGDFVIVTTSRGQEMAQVVVIEKDFKAKRENPLKPIDRRATPQDLVMGRMWARRELEALINCREKAAELKMKGVRIAKAEYSFDGSRLSFLYSSEGNEKKDVQKLISKLQRSYRKSKVEMREVGPRDVAKVIGGMGACGLEERCCSRFLSEFSPISIRMAKAQGVSLNPQEITGMCGRLRCCLIYEYDLYVKARKELPKKNKRVITPSGEGKVIDVVPLKGTVIVALEDGMRLEFPKEDLEPYEELKALQDKANKPCPIHKDGNCNCNQKKNGS
jgi:cell fate regulator YaaT (PSP1 superfamily)